MFVLSAWFVAIAVLIWLERRSGEGDAQIWILKTYPSIDPDPDHRPSLVLI